VSPRPKPVVSNARPAGTDHQVVSVTGGGGGYRRQPCGPQQPTEARPGCPWRVDGTGFFPAEAFAHSANTAEDLSVQTFGCHESGARDPKVCAGFLLRGSDHNMAVRMRLSSGAINPHEVTDGGHELHPGYVSMAVANGVDPDDPVLRNCRLSYEEEEAR
jgi:hypothetical protein